MIKITFLLIWASLKIREDLFSIRYQGFWGEWLALSESIVTAVDVAGDIWEGRWEVMRSFQRETENKDQSQFPPLGSCISRSCETHGVVTPATRSEVYYFQGQDYGVK